MQPVVPHAAELSDPLRSLAPRPSLEPRPSWPTVSTAVRIVVRTGATDARRWPCSTAWFEEDAMTQSHLVIDFPIKAPANAKALAEELPPLMPDFAKVQDDLGTVHFSRFMVEGDGKLLFVSDIDGEAAPILSGSWSARARCWTPSSNTWTTLPRQQRGSPVGGRQMAEAPCPRASRNVLRLRGCFGAGHQGVRACGGLHRQYVAGHLADIHVHQARAGSCIVRGGGSHSRGSLCNVGCCWDAALLRLGGLRGQPRGLLHHLRR